ncbi:hypothetical protein [Corynebacterium sp. 13CS0277]|uniref:hypothetical protein n=1 Tax=Corynebacterium sp. 13CS0277 TaxID=2071994 RepID=UPI0011B26FF1|nr:hypothetical protein [Corynebacterium sp. 13CS0277]
MTLQYGPPVHFPTIQVAGFIVTAVLGACYAAWTAAPHKLHIYVVGGVLAAGFATAFMLGDSFGVPAQNGVGVFACWMIVCPVTVVLGGVARRVKQWRRGGA